MALSNSHVPTFEVKVRCVFATFPLPFLLSNANFSPFLKVQKPEYLSCPSKHLIDELPLADNLVLTFGIGTVPKWKLCQRNNLTVIPSSRCVYITFLQTTQTEVFLNSFQTSAVLSNILSTRKLSAACQRIKWQYNWLHKRRWGRTPLTL